MVSTVSIIQADNCSTVPISNLDKISFVNISLISLAWYIQYMIVRFECPWVLDPQPRFGKRRDFLWYFFLQFLLTHFPSFHAWRLDRTHWWRWCSRPPFVLFCYCGMLSDDDAKVIYGCGRYTISWDLTLSAAHVMSTMVMVMMIRLVGTMVTMRMRFKDWRAVSRLVRFLDRRPWAIKIVIS